MFSSSSRDARCALHLEYRARESDSTGDLVATRVAIYGLANAISLEALATLSPYQTEHINRFGNYVLDMSSPPTLLPFTLPERRSPRVPDGRRWRCVRIWRESLL